MSHEAPPATSAVPVLPSAFGRMSRPIGAWAIRRWYDVHVHGAGHVPRTGPVLVASNHLGILDGPLLLSLAPRYLHALVKWEMFSGFVGRVLEAAGQIPLDRSYIDVGAVKSAVRTLRDGGVVAIYPEGRRGNGDFGQVRLGVAYLALVTGAPVVPVATLGSRQPGQSVGTIPPRGVRIDLVFGAPLRPACDPVPWPRRRAEVAALAERFRKQLNAHVHSALAQTGQRLPGEPPDSGVEAGEPHGPEVGPQAEEQVP